MAVSNYVNTAIAAAVATVLAGGGSFYTVDRVGSNVQETLDGRLDAMAIQIAKVETALSGLPPPDLMRRIGQLERRVEDVKEFTSRATSDRYRRREAQEALIAVQRQIDELKREVIALRSFHQIRGKIEGAVPTNGEFKAFEGREVR